MLQEILTTAKRGGRITTATIIAGVIVQLTGDPKWLALVPVIAALGKFIRCFFNLPKLPF